MTGAGGWIGRASAVRLAREGASVEVADLRLASAQETVAILEAEGHTGLAVECDVRDRESGVALGFEDRDRLRAEASRRSATSPTLPRGPA